MHQHRDRIASLISYFSFALILAEVIKLRALRQSGFLCTQDCAAHNMDVTNRGALKGFISDKYHYGHSSRYPTSGGFPHPPASWLHILPLHANSEHVRLNTLRNMWQPQSNHNITKELGTSTWTYLKGEITLSSVSSACQSVCQAAVKIPGVLCVNWQLNMPTCCQCFRSHLACIYNSIRSSPVVGRLCTSAQL